MKRKTVSAEMLGNFMYHIAHTLRTPLNGIRWATEMLKNEEVGDLTGGQRELLDTIERSSVEVLRLAGQLQDAFIALRGGPLRMRLSACDMAAIVDEAAGAQAVSARRKDLRLVWSRPAGAIPALCDRTRISQVVSILLENAIHYSKPGRSIELSVAVVGKKPGPALSRALALPRSVHDSVVVSIRDAGIGIPLEERIHVFEPFFRAKNANELWVDGTGISLALAQAVVSQLGGRMWFTSVRGLGTIMRFSLPAARPAPHKA